MWTSKTLQPIFFESSGHLANFGLSYSAMALAGYFSFLTGSLTDHLGTQKTLGIGSVLYGIGLLLRSFPDYASVAVMSGLIAGTGASMVINALRLWLIDMSTESNRARYIGIKSSTAALGNAIGCALAGLLPLLAITMKNIMFSVGVMLSVIGMMTLFFAKKDASTVNQKKRSPLTDIKIIFSSHRRLAVYTSVIGVLTGFYVSFVSPYLPLIMKQKGLDMSSIGLSIGAFSLIRFFVDPVIARWIEKRIESKLAIFLTAEFSILLITGVFALSISKSLFIVFLIGRSVALGFSTISEELLWIQKFPREMVGLLFGVNQSAFFLGDFIGGLTNGVIYQNFGLTLCVFIALAVIILNAYLFTRLFKKEKQTVFESEMVVTV
jgi:MFS family permease